MTITRPAEAPVALLANPERHPERYCGRCDGPNPSWHAASPLWNAVMRTGDREPFDGIICPNCFAVLAVEAGVTSHICLTTHDAKVPLATTMDVRVWDAAACMWVAPAASADPLITYTDPAGGPDWEPREDEA